jgi:hypothetical protein
MYNIQYAQMLLLAKFDFKDTKTDHIIIKDETHELKYWRKLRNEELWDKSLDETQTRLLLMGRQTWRIRCDQRNSSKEVYMLHTHVASGEVHDMQTTGQRDRYSMYSSRHW